MPTNTFNNLSKEKKDKIILASMNEFSKHTYSDVSINEIIEQAGISRGSFYMYFKDKEDLFYALLDEHKNKFKEITRESLINNSGNLFEAYIEIYDKTIKYILGKEELSFFKNVFFNLNYKNENCIVPQHENKGKLIKDLEDIINIKILNINNSDDLSDMFDILMGVLIKSIVKTIHQAPNEREKFVNKINLLKTGFYRKENL